MSKIREVSDPNLIVGFATSDDAAVYKITEEIALVQTLDFITPLVDDPFTFGQIAAANSLSDVYAMGGKPLTAMNICCFPSEGIQKATLSRILEGGYEKVRESGAALVGGHTIEDQELKYGLSVTGIIDPRKAITNSNAKVGDRIILTKPLGTALYISAFRANMIDENALSHAVDSMILLNKTASELMLAHDAHACTDVTGFALSGHLLDIADASDVRIEVSFSALPTFESVFDIARKGLLTKLTKSNRETYSRRISIDAKITESEEIILYDPQTSGGLLIFVEEDHTDLLVSDLHGAGMRSSSIIGRVIESGHPSIRVAP